LREKVDKLKELKTRVLLISFEEREFWINAWLEETKAKFSLLIDPDRRVYGKYGMISSRRRAWGPKTIIYYIMALVRKKRILKTGGDTGQMGGDFIIDGGGRIAMARRSRGPTDRPSIDEIIAVLERLSI